MRYLSFSALSQALHMLHIKTMKIVMDHVLMLAVVKEAQMYMQALHVHIIQVNHTIIQARGVVTAPL